MDKQGNLITDFPEHETSIYWINHEKSDQLYFMLGYPIAFLGFLFQSTQNFEFFEAACSGLFSIRPDQRLEKLITSVMKHFLATQA